MMGAKSSSLRVGSVWAPGRLAAVPLSSAAGCRGTESTSWVCSLHRREGIVTRRAATVLMLFVVCYHGYYRSIVQWASMIDDKSNKKNIFFCAMLGDQN